jgi:predicted CoA-binding protein
MTPAEIGALLRQAKRIAVVGLGESTWRPAWGVAAYLQRAGYTIVPVHPRAGTVLGERAVPDLAEAARGGPVDIVNVFRRSDAIPSLVDPCVAVRPLLVWLQVGIRHDESARRIEAAGIPVVQDRCLAVDHHQLLGL